MLLMGKKKMLYTVNAKTFVSPTSSIHTVGELNLTELIIALEIATPKWQKEVLDLILFLLQR